MLGGGLRVIETRPQGNFFEGLALSGQDTGEGGRSLILPPRAWTAAEQFRAAVGPLVS